MLPKRKEEGYCFERVLKLLQVYETFRPLLILFQLISSVIYGFLNILYVLEEIICYLDVLKVQDPSCNISRSYVNPALFLSVS